MGSGKSTVGKLLADSLGYEFVDTDLLIEQREGMKIGEIFERFSEEYFRKLELATLKDLLGRSRIVVGTGGGLGANPHAMDLMKEKGLVVWLDVPFDVFLQRCAEDPNRPLLKMGLEKLEELYTKRMEVYSKAHVRLDATREPQELVNQLLQILRGKI